MPALMHKQLGKKYEVVHFGLIRGELARKHASDNGQHQVQSGGPQEKSLKKALRGLRRNTCHPGDRRSIFYLLTHTLPNLAKRTSVQSGRMRNRGVENQCPGA